MFDSKKEDQNISEPKQLDMKENEEDNVTKNLKFKVHTMPQKFHSQKTASSSFDSPQKKKNDSGKFVLIIVIIIVILGLGVVGYLLLKSGSEETPTNTTNENLNENIALNFSTNRTQNTNTANSNNNTNINNANTNNTNSVINTNSARSLSDLSLTQDLDGDLLTDLEEDDYGTNKTVKDTDEDTFDDATELIFGFSPLSKGTLVGSVSIAEYTNTSFGFSVLYPKGWTTQPRGNDGRGALFIPNVSTGEYIEVSVQDNLGRLTPEQWYLAQTSGNVKASDLTEVENWDETETAVVSPDGFSTFYSFGNYIFSIYYETNDQDEVGYKTTYDTLRRSISFVSVLPVANSNSNVNTTNTNTNVNNANQNTNIDVTINTP